MTTDAWLAGHPYLRPIARFCAEVDSAASKIEIEIADVPSWDEYASDFQDGVPLVQSSAAAIDLAPAGMMACALVDGLASSALSIRQVEDARTLSAELRADVDASRHVVDWLMGEESFAPSTPGLLRYLGWTATARYLRPVVKALEGWRDEERWLRNYCPTCGSLPAMSQLIGVDPSRLRYLSCGCCATRWRFNRTACPFCQNDSQRLAVIAVEREAHLRIDSCESCRGYLKAYIGQGDEPLYLSDWSSLHLDFIALDRGLKRAAASLYELEPAPHASEDPDEARSAARTGR